jgi:hypothetical protein
VFEAPHISVLLTAVLLVKASVSANDPNIWKPAVFRGLVIGKSTENQLIAVLGKPQWVGREQDTNLPMLTFHTTGMGTQFARG